MDHSDDEQVLERLAADASRTGPRWSLAVATRASPYAATCAELALSAAEA